MDRLVLRETEEPLAMHLDVSPKEGRTCVVPDFAPCHVTFSLTDLTNQDIGLDKRGRAEQKVAARTSEKVCRREHGDKNPRSEGWSDPLPNTRANLASLLRSEKVLLNEDPP